MSPPSPSTTPDPRHVAVIMDGNRRWAKARDLPPQVGYEAAEVAEWELIMAALKKEIRYLTLFAFSTDNWKRPSDEVERVLLLRRERLEKWIAPLKEMHVRIRWLGRKEGLPVDLLEVLEKAQAETSFNNRMDLTLCINYGGRAEIEDASTRGKVAPNLYAPDLPDVDLLIRTSGERRMSNFMLWQCAYSELYFTRTLWPDFKRSSLYAALRWYKGRERRFGDVEHSSQNEPNG